MLPPEINSGLLYTGPGSGPMFAAADAWEGLAAELHSAASSYESVVAGLTKRPWNGPFIGDDGGSSRIPRGVDERHRHASRASGQPGHSGRSRL